MIEVFGGPGEIRTHDLFHAMEDKPSHLGIAALKTKNLENSDSLRNRSWHYRSIGETAPDRSGFLLIFKSRTGREQVYRLFRLAAIAPRRKRAPFTHRAVK